MSFDAGQIRWQLERMRHLHVDERGRSWHLPGRTLTLLLLTLSGCTSSELRQRLGATGDDIAEADDAAGNDSRDNDSEAGPSNSEAGDGDRFEDGGAPAASEEGVAGAADAAVAEDSPSEGGKSPGSEIADARDGGVVGDDSPEQGTEDSQPEPAATELCGDGVVDSGEECDDGNNEERDGCSAACRLWFDTDFTRRTRIDLSNPTALEVESFPVLVNLNANSIDWAELGDTGLCVVDADGKTVLPVDAESFTAGSDSLIWVQVPSLTPNADWSASGSSDHIWLYYGNTTSSEGCSLTTSVWRDEYAGVWHMDGIADSSPHAHVMTDNGTTDAAGVVGRARATDQAGILGPNSPVLHIIGDLTLSAWVSFDSLDSGVYQNGIITYGAPNLAANVNFAYGLYLTNDFRLRTYWAHDVSVAVVHTSSPSAAALNTFHHVAVVRDTSAGVVRFFLDGAQVGDDIVYDALPDGGEDGVLLLGGNIFRDNYSMHGVIDEARIARRASSNEWIELEYRSMTGALASAVMDP